MTINADIQDAHVQHIFSVLNRYKFPLSDEKQLQALMETVFQKEGIVYQREYRFNANDIVDFFIDGLAIEVKIKGAKKAVYRQCERYCIHDETKALLLVTSLAMGFPSEINKKPCYFYSLGKNWL